MLIDPMEFMKYDKISDDVYTLGPNTVLRFNVSLSKITSDGKRYHYYKEFEYQSRASNQDTLITVKRNYDYYLSIENVQKNRTTDDKAFIRIGIQEYPKFRAQLEVVYSWFHSKEFKRLFARNKGKLVLTSPVPEDAINGYPQNKFIRFVPTIIDKGEGKDRLEPGIEMDLSSYDNYVLMNYDRFMGLYYLIANFSMYQAAQNLVGCLGLPEGLNRFNMGSAGAEKLITADEFEGKTEGVSEHTISSMKNISSLE